MLELRVQLRCASSLSTSPMHNSHSIRRITSSHPFFFIFVNCRPPFQLHTAGCLCNQLAIDLHSAAAEHSQFAAPHLRAATARVSCAPEKELGATKATAEAAMPTAMVALRMGAMVL
jgi:hypothetical protein